jgi:hypothetical protein
VKRAARPHRKAGSISNAGDRQISVVLLQPLNLGGQVIGSHSDAKINMSDALQSHHPPERAEYA